MSLPIIKSMFSAIDRFVRGYIVVQSDHAYIHDGIGFSLPLEQALTSGQKYYLSFKTPAASVGYVHWRPTNIASTATAIITRLYVGETITSGTDVSANIMNKNQNSSNSSGVTIKAGVSVTPSTYPLQLGAAGSAGGPTARSGGQTGSEEEIVLVPETEYALEVEEVGGAATTAVGTLFWYEEEEGIQ